VSAAPQRFRRHYSPAEARELLPGIRRWLDEIRTLQRDLQRAAERNAALFAEGRDLGGERINGQLGALARLREVAREFSQREIQIKDLERGLIDFPSLRGDREVLLCWEEGEADIEFWHDLETGFAGRQPL